MSDTTALVLPFADIGADDLPLVGGKGANLGVMAAAGLPVPPGFCVTTVAFRRFLSGDGGAAARWVYEALDPIPPDDVEEVRRVGAEVRERLSALPVPAEVEAAVLDAWRSLGEGQAYAVRSSATAEDLPGASFAGQQDTFLNVRGAAALVESLKGCWVSLFTDRAILYRAQNGFGHRDVALSVVVQQMVEPVVSGILFTADPLTGNRQVVSIDAGFGLGEALVSGVVSADLYRVDKHSGTLIESKIADKTMAIRAKPDGGTFREDLPEELRRAPALNEWQALDLAATGVRIEALYGRPQDIEWCIDEADQVFIVQSRPITSLYPLAEPVPEDSALHVYLSFGHVQVMTDPIAPMGRSVLRLALPFGKGGRLTVENPFVKTAGSRLYLDVTPLMYLEPVRRLVPRALGAVDALIGGALAEVIERPAFLAGAEHAAKRVSRPELAHTFLPLLAEAQKWMWLRRPEEAVARLGAFCDAQIDAARARLADEPPGLPRLTAAREILVGTFKVALPTVIPAVASGMLSRVLLLRVTGDREGVDALLRGFEGNVTTEMDLEVGDLADIARRSDAVSARLLAGDVVTVIDDLSGVPESEDFLTVWRAFLDRYGSRGPSEIDITRPRWSEDSASLVQVVVGHLQREAPGEHREQQRRLIAEGKAAADRLVATAARGPLGPARAPLVRRLTRVVRGMLAIREHPKFMIVRLLWLVKLVMREGAGELVAQRRLDSAEDVWFLSFGELIAAFEDPSLPLRDVVAERRAEHLRDGNLRPPRVMTSDGEIPQVRHERAGLPAGALAGSAASAGVVEGIAHVVRDPTIEVLSPGEILVAPFSDPGWTPLFINAAGLVMEVGGLMTHGSVVAREYGIPAVVGVLDATRLIRTGERVRVNGDAGYVEVLEGGDVGTD